MTDLLFVFLLAAMFAVTVGAVAVCDRLLGADDTVSARPLVDDEAEGVAA